MWFANLVLNDIGQNWSLYVSALFVLILFLKFFGKIRNGFFEFITVFTIPGTISFVALLILVIYFYSNNFKADDTIVKLLALIVINFHLPTILTTITGIVSRVKGFRFGQVSAEFDVGSTNDLRTQNQISQTTTIISGKTSKDLYPLFESIQQKLSYLYALKFVGEILPKNMFEAVLKFVEVNFMDKKTAVVLFAIINLSDQIYLGYQPAQNETDKIYDYCVYAVDYLNKKIDETMTSAAPE